MGAVNGDLIQITDFQTYMGQQMLNVYYYRYVFASPMDDAGYNDLLASFKAGVVDAVRALQCPNATHTSLELKNLSNGLDIVTSVLGSDNTGTLGGSDYLPSFVTIGFILRRQSLATRNGYKRIGGLDSVAITDNSVSASTAITDAIRAEMASDIFSGAADVLSPVIVRRPITPPVGGYTFSYVGDVELGRVGTQNTRKAGRGN